MKNGKIDFTQLNFPGWLFSLGWFVAMKHFCEVSCFFCISVLLKETSDFVSSDLDWWVFWFVRTLIEHEIKQYTKRY